MSNSPGLTPSSGSASAEVDTPPPEEPKKPSLAPAADLWAQLQTVRAEHWQGDGAPRGQALTDKRRRNLHARRKELRRAGYTDEDLLRAATWVHDSGNIRAEGARSTGDPLTVLLRPAHCVDYVELAIAEQEGAAPAVRAADPVADRKAAEERARLESELESRERSIQRREARGKPVHPQDYADVAYLRERMGLPPDGGPRLTVVAGGER